MAGGVCGKGGACMVVGVHGGGCTWQGGMCGRGVCMAGGGMFGWEGACVAGETATAADGTHPTGMFSC